MADHTWGPGVSLKGAQEAPGNAKVFSTGWIVLNNINWTSDNLDVKLNSDIVNPIYYYAPLDYLNYFAVLSFDLLSFFDLPILHTAKDLFFIYGY